MKWLENIYYNIKNGIVNIIRWLPVIWQDRDWDDVFIFILFHKKLDNMEQFFRSDKSWSAKADKVANELKLAKLLCNRIINYDYLGNALIPFHKKYGEVKLFEFEQIEGESFSTYKDLLNEEQDKIWNRASKHSDYMEKQDKDYLFKHIRKYIDGWWD